MRTCTYAMMTAAMLAVPAVALAAPETFNLEKPHTDVTFTISHLGYSMKHGEFRDLEGQLVLDQKAPANSKLDVTIKVASLDTGFAARDKDLLAPMFFDAEKYPTIKFVSTSVKQIGKETADVTGALTIHGVTKTTVLHVKLNKIGVSPLDRRNTAGFTATAHVKRSDFGMKTFLPMVGDDVAIVIDSEFTQPAAAQK